MAQQRAARLAGLALAAAVVLAAATGAVGLGRPRVAGVAGYGAGDAAAALVMLACVAVGALIVTRRPGNRIGWLFCAIGLPVLLSAFSTQYADAALLVRGSRLPAGPVMAWLATWPGPLGLSLLFYLLVLFPDGRAPSRGWRALGWLYGVSLGAGLAASALRPGTSRVFLGDLGPIANPLGWRAAAAPLGAVEAASRALSTVLLPAGVVALVLRLRRSRGVARQQLKWLAYAGVVLVAAIVAEGVLQGTGRDRGLLGIGFGLLLLGGLLGIPAAAGVAILRHRLYDIDRLVNRTIVYGLLSALLGAAYAGLVLGIGQLLEAARASGSLAVAAATLAVAALFQPARVRVQRAVDRRFNRRRYAAAVTVAAFSARLRQQLDLEALGRELTALVDRTLEPTTVSLWLRPPP
jgi:hypothetical protein